MNLLQAQDWSFPVPIAYGPGRLREIASFSAKAGMAKPLIVTDRGSRNLPFIADVGRYLEAGAIGSAVFGEISPNPRGAEIASGRAAFRRGGHDGIIAIGGGSGMDGAKAIALVARNEIEAVIEEALSKGR